MKKILFPTDFSETAANAFEYALQLADRLEGRLDLMTVYHLPINDAGRVPPDSIERMLQEKKAQAMAKIKGFAEGAPAERIGKVRADYGLFIAQEITDAARREGYDLIIMGTKGQHNPLEKVLGSVTTQTLMNAPCPVFAIPQDAAFTEIEHIAYATDFRPTDEHAVNTLMELAGELAAQVHFIHIDTKAKIGGMEEEIELEEYPFNFTDFTILNKASITDGLDNYMREKHIDLLALFIPRRRLWERLFHTSFTKKMTFHTKLPLLVFRE